MQTRSVQGKYSLTKLGLLLIMLSFFWNIWKVHYAVTRPQFCDDHGELTVQKTKRTGILEALPCTGREDTRCYGDSASSSCIPLLPELGQYFLFCSLAIFRSFMHTVQFLLQKIHTTTLNSCAPGKAHVPTAAETKKTGVCEMRTRV